MNVFQRFEWTVTIALVCMAIILGLVQSVPRLGKWALRFQDITIRSSDWIFFSFAAIYALVFGSLSILRHLSLNSGGWDLGIFDQVVWNSLRGRLFENSIMTDSPSILGLHFSPILLAVVPLYSVWSDPIVLLMLQTLALTLAAFPLYWFGRKQIGPGLALVVSAAYFLSPSLQSINLWEFHEIALATPLLSLAIYFLLRERYGPFTAVVFLSSIVKEEMGIIIAAFGIFLVLVRHRHALGAVLVGVGVTWICVTLLWVIPSFRNAASGDVFGYLVHYDYLGKTVPQIILSLVTRPDLILEHLLVPGKLEFVLQLLVPLAFVAILGIDILALAFPTLAYLLISSSPTVYSIRFQYTASLLPFVFFAAILGMARILRWNQLERLPLSSQRLALGVLIAAASLLNYYLQSVGPFGLYFDPSIYRPSPRAVEGRELMRNIPADAGLITQNQLAPHLSDRRYIYVAVLPSSSRAEYLLADTTVDVPYPYKLDWERVLHSHCWETVLEQSGYVLKKQISTAGHPELATECSH